MRANKLPPLERVQELLSYDPETGHFTWKINRSAGVKAGDRAGHKDNKGYWTLKLDGKRFKAQRIAWLMMTGEDPGELDVDHKNGDPLDNRFENIRPVTRTENILNSSTSQGITGVRGIETWADPWTKGFRASLTMNGKKRVGKVRATIEEALEDYKVFCDQTGVTELRKHLPKEV